MQLVLTILVVILAIIVTAMVTLQSGKSSGLDAISGGGNNSETFLAKNKAKSLDAKLARYTKWVAAVFVVLILILGMI